MIDLNHILLFVAIVAPVILLVRIARRAALADGTGDALRLLVMGATVVGVLAVSVSAHATLLQGEPAAGSEVAPSRMAA